MASFLAILGLVLGTIIPALTAARILTGIWNNTRQSPHGRGVSLILVALLGVFSLMYAVTGVTIYAFNALERDSYLKAQRYVTELLDAPGAVEFPPYESYSQTCQEILGCRARDPNAPSVDRHKPSGLTTVWGYVDVVSGPDHKERSKWRVVFRRGALQEIDIKPTTSQRAAHTKAPGTKVLIPDA